MNDHDELALFIVEVPDDEVTSRVCERHLVNAVRAANVDFGYRGAIVHLINRQAGFRCEWDGDDSDYADYPMGPPGDIHRYKPGKNGPNA